MQERRIDLRHAPWHILVALPLLLLLLGGCGKAVSPARELKDTLHLYERSLRWGDFAMASDYFEEALRKDFLARFQDADDLKIVNVHLVSVDYHPEPRAATTEMTLEYYHLPSPIVHKVRFTQHWTYQGGDTYTPGSWQTATPLPAFAD